LTDLCNREDTRLEDLSQIITYDASLCATILRIASFSERNPSKRIGDISHALKVLDTGSLKTVVLGASLHQAFEKDGAGSIFSLKRFWWHSLMCALISESIAQKTSYQSPGGAFLAGILHDIGKLILAINFPWEYERILLRTRDHPEMLLIEEDRLGATHSEVGAWMLNQWNLQPFISDAVCYHHEPAERIHDAFPLVKIIYVANTLSRATIDTEHIKAEIATRILGLSWSDVEKIVSEARSKVDQIARSLEISIDLHEAAEKRVSFRDHQKQRELAQSLTNTARDISLLHGAFQYLFRTFDEDSIIAAILQGLHALFNMGNVLLFLYDPDKDMLIAKKRNGYELDDPIDGATISLERGKSLLVKALVQGVPLDSLSHQKDEPLTIIDEQIMHVTGGEVLLCLPMVSEGQSIGVIAIGIDENQSSQLKRQLKLLTMFANQAAVALHMNSLRKKQPALDRSQGFPVSSIMARKVVHEVSTPLNIIKNYLKILERKSSGEDWGKDELKIINEEIERISVILGELANLSEFKPRPTDHFDFNALISEVVKIFKESFLLGPHIEVHIEHDQNLPRITTDKNGMKQVIMNLIQNAIDALPEGGNIQIATRYISHHPEASIPLEARGDVESDYVEITISDDGPGIPPIIKSRLFEPYTTTRGEEHAGLGLYIVHNIVKGLKGSVTYESEEESGTSVKVVLPIGTPGTLNMGR
jgi:signal transduction histidine kinase/HD-like signal output (HDOD) protein